MIIDAIVLLYGVIVLYAHNNLRNVVRRMESMMLEVANEIGGQLDFHQVHHLFAERWKSEWGARRIFLPTRRDLWFNRIGAAELVDLLHIEPDYIKMALHKNTGEPQAQDFHPVDYLLWEEYRHRLLTGLRSRLPDPREAKLRFEQKQRARK
jgi:hypothetical protein